MNDYGLDLKNVNFKVQFLPQQWIHKLIEIPPYFIQDLENSFTG